MDIPQAALSAIEQLNSAGFSAYLVGGCVRDLLLGREPGDFDITTAALPEQVEAVFAGQRIIETGLKHGTVTVLLGGMPLEITTYRQDVSYSDHRHPDAVRFTPRLEEDLARRDFTVNAMAWHPEEGLADRFGGREDLERGLIRCVGEPSARFGEDALRILRALRFSSVLGFAIEPETAAAALELRQTLELVSRERIAAELTKLICGKDVRRVVTEHWPILAVPIPELTAMADCDQHSKYHCYDVLTHCAVSAEAVPPEKIVRWAALLHDVGKPYRFSMDEAGCGHFYGHAEVGAEMTEEILTRLRFDRDTVRRVRALVELHDYPLDPAAQSSAKGVKKLLRRLGEEDFFRLLDVKRGDSMAHAPQYRERIEICDRAEAQARELLAQAACFTLKDLAVKGGDLQAIGVPPGPEMGRILDRLLDEVISDRIPNEKQVLLDRANALRRES